MSSSTLVEHPEGLPIDAYVLWQRKDYLQDSIELAQQLLNFLETDNPQCGFYRQWTEYLTTYEPFPDYLINLSADQAYNFPSEWPQRLLTVQNAF
jgi:hypothetical protein